MDSREIKISQTATAEEAAAVSAAIQRFDGDTAITPDPDTAGIDPWLKAALSEGVAAKSLFGPGGAEDPF